MFGSDFGVSVTVSQRPSARPGLPVPLPAGVTRRRARLSEVIDVAGMDEVGLAEELGTIADARSQLAAYEAVVVARFAALRPADTDRGPEEPGHRVAGWCAEEPPAGVSEFFADELAMVRGTSPQAAGTLLDRSLVLVHQLPDTCAALADSVIDEPRAAAIAKALGGQGEPFGGRVDPGVVAQVEAQALAWAVARETPRRLQERVAAALIALDEAAADRRRKKHERNTDVVVRSLPDGMAELTATLPAPVAAACRETVDGYARMAKADGDERPIGQLRAEIMADLVLRPWDTSREPVTAHLHVLAPLPAAGDTASGEAATVDGAPITAGQLRELLEQLDALCPGGLQAPIGGSLGIDLTDPATGELRATVTRPELERLVRAGAVLDRPPPIDRYEPTPAQQRFVKARDRTCRHPGCRRPARWTDADHVVAHADGGETDCANLCSLCRRHHRLKTHAPGWRFVMDDDGTLHVTTPSGVTRTTRPPGLRLPLALTTAADDPDDPPPF